MKLLPRDQFDPVEALSLLKANGFLQSYESNGCMFGFIVNWHKYQDPHPGERPIFPKPFLDPNFYVRIKPPKYRSSVDIGFGRFDIHQGISQFQQVVSKLYEPCSEVASKAFPSLPSSPSLPTKEETQAAPSAPLLGVGIKPGRREKKKQKLGTFPEEVVQMVSRLIDLWPTERGGQTFRSDDVKACGNVVLILEEFGDVTVAKLEAAAMGYLSTKPPYPNALEFWFGKSKTAPWRAEVMLVNREARVI